MANEWYLVKGPESNDLSAQNCLRGFKRYRFQPGIPEETQWFGHEIKQHKRGTKTSNHAAGFHIVQLRYPGVAATKYKP